jgi:hypothetical protein
MRYRFIILSLILAGCGGTLSDEQRKKMREQMELREIRKVTDAEITEAAFAKGRQILSLLDNFQGDSTRIDSLITAENGRVRWLVPGTSNALALEQQLIDAYVAGASGGIQDNVQKIRNTEGESDSLLYTKPVVIRADGVERLEGVWNIWLSKKQLILSMDKK